MESKYDTTFLKEWHENRKVEVRREWIRHYDVVENKT
jgi:hypothetical protein